MTATDAALANLQSLVEALANRMGETEQRVDNVCELLTEMRRRVVPPPTPDLAAQLAEARREAKQWEAIATGPEGRADDVAELIADFVQRGEFAGDLMDMTDPNDPVGVALTRAADALRAGKWRTK